MFDSGGMTKSGMPKKYDLEERTLAFAQSVRFFLKRIPRTISNIEDAKQLARSSGSIAANYIEACDPLSRKDGLKHLRICRKEAKESCVWLRLLDLGGKSDLLDVHQKLYQEAKELTLIFGSIVQRSPSI